MLYLPWLQCRIIILRYYDYYFYYYYYVGRYTRGVLLYAPWLGTPREYNNNIIYVCIYTSAQYRKHHYRPSPIALTHRNLRVYILHYLCTSIMCVCVLFFHLCMITHTYILPPLLPLPPRPSHPHKRLFEPGGNRPDRFWIRFWKKKK